MSVRRHLISLERPELTELYRHWAGEPVLPDANEELLKEDLHRLMTDRDGVSLRFRELPPKCRDFLSWLLRQEDYAVPVTKLEEEQADLPVPSFEVEAIAFALKKRGFLTEARDRSWMHYEESVLRVPTELGDLLSSFSRPDRRTFESQLTLRAFLQNLTRDEVRSRLTKLGLSPDLHSDRQALCEQIGSPEVIQRSIDSLPTPEIRNTVARVLQDHGGIGEVRHLERLGLMVGDIAKFRQMLEERLLGTILDGDLTDVGLQLGAGSVIIFLDLVRMVFTRQLETSVEDEPEPPADLLADISSVRTFLDHHSVRVTRDGSLYRATLRKMGAELLSPGWRPVDGDEALEFILRFLTDAELLRPDAEGRMRTTKAWRDFEARGPVEQAELVLTYVQSDVREAQGAFHLPKQRKLLQNLLREFGPQKWISIRALSVLARNRYFVTLDRPTIADRFQKRYKYTPIPPMATPAALLRELTRYCGERLPLSGLVVTATVEDQPVALRLTRLGAALLGLPAAPEPTAEDGALIVTADFEIVLFPEAGGVHLAHEIGRFAKREKADYSLHFRITDRSVQEGVASGMSAEEICALLKRHARHDLPQNVEQSIRSFAASVNVLAARRTILLRAVSAEALEAVMKIRELKAIAGERLNPTTLELTEDPSTPRVAEALRTLGFVLRST